VLAQHYHDICLVKVCRDNECKARHPKYCKNGYGCKFYKKKVFAYKHEDLKSVEAIRTQNLMKDNEALEEEVKKLKVEIAELKENVIKKEQKIEQIFQDKSKSIEKCLKENKSLKDILYKNEISIEDLRKDNEGLKAANQTLNEKIANQQMKFLEMMIKYDEMTKLVRKTNTNKTSLGNFKCKKCDRYFPSKVNLDEHQNLHCDICGEIFQNIIHLKKHENNPGHY
jgi:chromosome segregation ATPase